MNKILITGVSGLLGQALAEIFLENDFFVLGQYFRHRPEEKENAKWIQGSLSGLENIRDFLEKNRADLTASEFLINNYGPITVKNVSELTAEDYCSDFVSNVLSATEITRFLILQGNLNSVINIGFENAGRTMPFKKVLSYAIAKNALLLITKSLAEQYPHIRFNLVSPASMTGASEVLKRKQPVPPREVASEIFKLIRSDKSGSHIMIG